MYINCGYQSRNGKDPYIMPEQIEILNESIDNHPQVVNSPIYNEKWLVPDSELPGKTN